MRRVLSCGLQVAVHAVEIGPGGDGTLEALSRGTGGEFVRVAD